MNVASVLQMDDADAERSEPERIYFIYRKSNVACASVPPSKNLSSRRRHDPAHAFDVFHAYVYRPVAGS